MFRPIWDEKIEIIIKEVKQYRFKIMIFGITVNPINKNWISNLPIFNLKGKFFTSINYIIR